jgi:hypothetical protein
MAKYKQIVAKFKEIGVWFSRSDFPFILFLLSLFTFFASVQIDVLRSFVVEIVQVLEEHCHE